MSEVIADRDYFTDQNGDLTTDSTKAADWLVRKGSPISKEHQEKYNIPLQTSVQSGKDVDGGKKASSPSSNKATSPKENKGAKK